MRELQRFSGAEAPSRSRASRLVTIAVSSLLVLLAITLGWLAVQLFLASVV